MYRRIHNPVLGISDGFLREVKAKTGFRQGAAYAVIPEEREHSTFSVAGTERERGREERIEAVG